ncbi:YeeE/YedE family protein [Phreatobacter sp.]|uniref:YeeE/YedE family protein n=1 Tax=Phreatobacter sp. TaxID=1966341 RepID=UPI003F71CAE5
MTDFATTATLSRPRRRVLPGQPVVTLAAALLIVIGAVLAGQTAGWRMAALWLVGAGLGLSLYHAAFGFTSGFRTLFETGRSAHVRAQMLMLATALILFLPALAAGSVLGQPVRGFVFPLGLEVAIGAFLFGIGMQLGGGCGSGTLYTVAGGGTRMIVTLAFFVLGATGAAYTVESWSGLPSLPGISLLDSLGLAPALVVSLAPLALVAWVVTRREKARHGDLEPLFARRGRAFLTGPWPYAWAALALALLNFATLLLAGRPWGITQAFALWGSWGIERLGLDDPAFWAFWEEPTRADLLHRRLFADITSVMNIGIVVGALAAAALAGRFAPVWRIGLAPLAASVIGGLLLGFGAIMATGCNVSAYFSGIASGSLHGWLWIAAALPGNWLGARLRPLFRL